MSESLWSDHRDDAVGEVFRGTPSRFVNDALEEAERRRLEEESKADARCWACARRSGTVPGGRVPLCLRHYVKLRLRYPSVLLDEDPQHRRGPAEPEHGSRATIGSIDEEERP